MNWTAVQRILGLLLMMFSLTMLPPIVIDIIFNEQAWLPFLKAFALTLAAGVIIWLPTVLELEIGENGVKKYKFLHARKDLMSNHTTLSIFDT